MSETTPPVDKPKQVCVIRQMYPNPDNPGTLKKLRTGKYVAQAGHAYQLAEWEARKRLIFTPHAAKQAANEPHARAWDAWKNGSIAKVCVYVKTEEELLSLWEKVHASGLPCALIQDSGLTEFGGKKTYTAIGIGPAYDSELKPLTGHLPLF